MYDLLTWVYTRHVSLQYYRKINSTALELSRERKPEHSINVIKLKSIKLAKTINDAVT